MQRKAFFITFEGGEGCGKSTQIALLARALEGVGESVLVLREPGGTIVGEKIRELLKSSDADFSLVPETELLLFAASRAQMVREKVRPALARGTWVLCDRFLDSTTVYQGVARSLGEGQVEQINRFAVGETLPDRTFYLDLPWATAKARLVGRAETFDRFEQEKDVFHEAVREGFVRLARENPERVCLFDATLSQEALAQAIRENLTTLRYGIF